MIFVYNNMIHSFMGMTLMKTLTAVHENLWINVNIDLSADNTPQAKKRAEVLKTMHENLKEVLTHAINAQKKQYDKQHKTIFFKIKNIIIIRTKNFHMIRSYHKLNYHQLRSFFIIDTWKKQVYKLKFLLQFKNIYSVFYVSLLELYCECKKTPLLLKLIFIDSSNK